MALHLRQIGVGLVLWGAHVPRGARLRSAWVIVHGRRVRAHRIPGSGGRRLRARVDLRGLPKGRFTVRIVERTTSGRRVSLRRYRTCATKRRRGG